jgi:hypothetical protein
LSSISLLIRSQWCVSWLFLQMGSPWLVHRFSYLHLSINLDSYWLLFL